MIKFAYSDLWVLIVLPFVMYLLPAVSGVHGDALRVTFLHDLAKINLKSGGLWKNRLISNRTMSVSQLLLFCIYSLLVIAATKPYWAGEPIRIKNEGRDILLVLDISTSMLDTDFTFSNQRLTRLQAVKLTASDFIDKRHDDRIGLVLFGSRAYLQAPVTFDKKAVKDILWMMDAGMAGNSTAIGDALGLALKSLKDSQDKDNKVIILLTDGENNDGSFSLPQAINLAKDEKIKIYTIGVGNSGSFVQSILSHKFSFSSDLDEASLKMIADEAGGRYFRASDTESLVKIYNEIDKLEPQSYEDNYTQEIKEYYYIPLLGAFILSLLLLFIKRRNK